MISNFTLLGLGWFVIFYLSFAALYARADRLLGEDNKAQLAVIRRALRPIAFVFVGALVGLLTIRPSCIWVFLVISCTLAMVLLHWLFRKSGMPKSYISSFNISSALYAIGTLGLAFALGHDGGYKL